MEIEVFSTLREDFMADFNGTDGGNHTFTATTLNIYRHGTGAVIALLVANIAVLLLGVGGNLLVIAVMYKTRRMRTVTNYFITNLAIADLLVLVFCLPPLLISNIYIRKLIRPSGYP